MARTTAAAYPELTGTRNPNALLPAVQTKRVERPRPRGHGAQRRKRPGQPAKVGTAWDGWSRGRDRSTRKVGITFGVNETWPAGPPENRVPSLRVLRAQWSEFWLAQV